MDSQEQCVFESLGSCASSVICETGSSDRFHFLEEKLLPSENWIAIVNI